MTNSLTVKAISTYNSHLHTGLTTALEAVVAMALEEAARLAEAFPARTHGSLATAPYAAAEQAGEEIAAAIRAMIGKESA